MEKTSGRDLTSLFAEWIFEQPPSEATKILGAPEATLFPLVPCFKPHSRVFDGAVQLCTENLCRWQDG